MRRALTTGIQIVNLFSFALCPSRKVGTAISATTAGRMPRKMAATILLSSNCLKKMAMARMIRNEGRAVPNAVAMAPRSSVLVYHLLFDQRNHGIATTEGEYAYLKEGFE